MKILFAILTLPAFLFSCRQHESLSGQLTVAFTAHLAKIEPSVKLDSVHILWDVPVTPKLGRVIDDSIYVREFTRVKAQLASALADKNQDSIDFYRYELDYMKKEIDSITRSISSGDTSVKFGYLIGCSYLIKKNDREKTDSTIVFIDSVYAMRYTEFLDSALKRSVRALN